MPIMNEGLKSMNASRQFTAAESLIREAGLAKRHTKCFCVHEHKHPWRYPMSAKVITWEQASEMHRKEFS